jgi:hypothetical protein
MGRPFVDFLERLARDEEWKAGAACAGKPTEWWYPHRGDRGRQANEICASCPVAVECDDYATEHRDVFGIWGGVSGRARRRKLQGLPDKPRFVTRKPIPHGTDAGYAAHHRRDEVSCEACRVAHAHRNRERASSEKEFEHVA